MFSFTSPSDARAEQVAITDTIRKAIEAGKSSNGPAVSTPKPVAGPGQSAAMAIAQAVTGGQDSGDSWANDASLTSNLELQRSLLTANPQLRQRFNESLNEKPPSISMSQFSLQFWSTRVDLLRAHAAERSQRHGAYHVLSEIKPKNVDGQWKLNLSKEQVELIFSQHPVVRRAYDENVPKMKEADFWGDLFQSRLIHKLRGEVITDAIPTHPILDKYLNLEDNAGPRPQFSETHVPHFIDLEGNEQNHSQKKGNRPDLTMRPNASEKVPILKVLNSTSEMMMADVAHVDGDPHGPVGMDEETFNEVQLRDLARQDTDNRIMLDIRDPKKFVAGAKDGKLSSEAERYAKLAPGKVLKPLKLSLEGAPTSLRLESTLGVNEDSDSDDDKAAGRRKPRIGSKAGRSAATAHILSAIKQRRMQTDDFTSPTGTFATVSQSVTGLSQATFDALVITQNTSVEFVHYFWSVYLSGDPDRAGELQKLVETLQKSIERLKAVAEGAESERQQEVERRQKQVEEYNKRTGKKRSFDPASIPGGAQAVNQVVLPTVRAIRAALREYKTTFEAQMAQAQLSND